jgi:hypothetical protein
MNLKWVHSLGALFILISRLFLPEDSLACTLFISISREHLNGPGNLSLCRHRSSPPES